MNVGLLVGLAIAWLYAATLAGLVAEWLSSPDASYGLILAGVAVACVWRRRAALTHADGPPAGSVYGAATLCGGLTLFLIGQLGADVFLTRISFVVVTAGSILFVGGVRPARTLAAPLVLLLLATPLPALVVNAMTLPLQLVASRIAESTLTALGVAVFRDGNLLELPSTTLAVADACSGLRSIVSLAAIGALLAWTAASWPRRAALVAASLPIAVTMNGLRIVATALACETWGPSAASDPWHTLGGWVTFLLSSLLLVCLYKLGTPAETRASWTPGVVSV
jgi:exosortase